MRLIDADALLEEIEGEFWYECDDKYNAIDVVEHAPRIEPSGELISREDAIEVVQDIVIDKEVIEAIKALPSAESVKGYNLETIADIVRQLGHLDSYIADRPKGEWIEKGGEIVCSECGNSVSFSRTPKGWVLGKFCQSCGADMRGAW